MFAAVPRSVGLSYTLKVATVVRCFCVLLTVADSGSFLQAGDFGNPTRTEGVWAYGIILFICELGRDIGIISNV